MLKDFERCYLVKSPQGKLEVATPQVYQPRNMLGWNYTCHDGSTGYYPVALGNVVKELPRECFDIARDRRMNESVESEQRFIKYCMDTKVFRLLTRVGVRGDKEVLSESLFFADTLEDATRIADKTVEGTDFKVVSLVIVR